jgi:hypothetical protein
MAGNGSRERPATRPKKELTSGTGSPIAPTSQGRRPGALAGYSFRLSAVVPEQRISNFWSHEFILWV